MAIVNYCIMSIIQLRNAPTIEEEISSQEAIQLYVLIEKEAFELMCKKIMIMEKLGEICVLVL